MRLEFLESTSKTSAIRTSYTDMRGCIIKAKFYVPQSGKGELAGIASGVAEKYTQDIAIDYAYEQSFMRWRFSKLHQWWDAGFRGWHEYEFDDTTDTLKVDGVVKPHTIHKQTVEVSGKPFCLMGALFYNSGGESMWNFVGSKCGEMKFTRPNGEIYAYFVPVMDNNGIPCMFDMVNKIPLYQNGTGQFIAGLTMKQAISLANLPATGGSLTVSLPLEAAFDANVQSALNAAAAKGWTIIVQYRESELTTENIDADFLEGTGTQWIETNLYMSKLHDLELRFSDLTGTQAWGRETGGFCLSFGRQSNDIRFIYWTESYREVRVPYVSGAVNVITKKGNEFSAQGVTAVANFTESTAASKDACRIFTYQGKTPYIAKMKWYSQKAWLMGALVQHILPALDSTGVPCLYDSVSGENFYNRGSGSFIVGFDTTEKAAISISKLPITTDGTLTVSLPAAAQDASSLVPEAINIATNRGWTIITQYRED